jgi:hypothetical protein
LLAGVTVAFSALSVAPFSVIRIFPEKVLSFVSLLQATLSDVI